MYFWAGQHEHVGAQLVLECRMYKQTLYFGHVITLSSITCKQLLTQSYIYKSLLALSKSPIIIN